MKRKTWKRIFVVSVVMLILLIVVTIVMWALLNVCGAIFLAMLGHRKIGAMPFSEYMSNFVGSPMFYICMADLTVLLGSATVLVTTRKK